MVAIFIDQHMAPYYNSLNCGHCLQFRLKSQSLNTIYMKIFSDLRYLCHYFFNYYLLTSRLSVFELKTIKNKLKFQNKIEFKHRLLKFNSNNRYQIKTNVTRPKLLNYSDLRRIKLKLKIY